MAFVAFAHLVRPRSHFGKCWAHEFASLNEMSREMIMDSPWEFYLRTPWIKVRLFDGVNYPWVIDETENEKDCGA